MLFGWLVIRNKIITWENLRKGGWVGPGRFFFCGENEEIMNHPFVSFPFVQAIWFLVKHSLKIMGPWKEEIVEPCLFLWLCDLHCKYFTNIPPLLWWGIWNQRNKIIFEGQVANILVVGAKVVGMERVRWQGKESEVKSTKSPSFDFSKP